MKLFKTLIAAALVSLPLAAAADEAPLPSAQATPSGETPTAGVVTVLILPLNQPGPTDLPANLVILVQVVEF